MDKSRSIDEGVLCDEDMADNQDLILVNERVDHGGVRVGVVSPRRETIKIG